MVESFLTTAFSTNQFEVKYKSQQPIIKTSLEFIGNLRIILKSIINPEAPVKEISKAQMS